MSLDSDTWESHLRVRVRAVVRHRTRGVWEWSDDGWVPPARWHDFASGRKGFGCSFLTAGGWASSGEQRAERCVNLVSWRYRCWWRLRCWGALLQAWGVGCYPRGELGLV